MVMPEATLGYADRDGSAIAYQVLGADGPTLVFAPGLLNHIESMWDVPFMARHLRRLASWSRLVLFDRLGAGQSDRLPANAGISPEDAAADITAVVDAVGGGDVAIYATADGALAAITFAAEHPELVTHLALWAASSRIRVGEDYPIGYPDDALPPPGPVARWGDRDRPHGARAMAPSLADDPDWMASVARMQRLAGSPATARRLLHAIHDADVRHYVTRIRCPTLVMHARGDRLYPLEHGRWVAEHIDGSTWRLLEGSDHFYFHENGDRVAEELERFVLGTARSRRLLANLVFVDVVASTEAARTMGDQHWHHLLTRLDEAIDTEADRHDGTTVSHTGDGALAYFATPSDALDYAHRLHTASATLGVRLRIGVHSGEVEVRDDHDVAGLNVHIAARTQAAAAPGHTLVTRTVRDLLTGVVEFDDRGVHEFKGIAEPWRLYEPAGQGAPPLSGHLT